MLCRYYNVGNSIIYWVIIKSHKKPHPLLDPNVVLGKILFPNKYFYRHEYKNPVTIARNKIVACEIEPHTGLIGVAWSYEVFKYIPNKNLSFYKNSMKFIEKHFLLK